MAFYTSNFCNSDIGDHNWTPYSDHYNHASAQMAAYSSSYDFNEPKFINFDSNSNSNFHYSDHDHALTVYDHTRPTINYSASFFSEPKVIEYDPNGDYTLLHRTEYMVSYSTMEFNEDDDVDYDPTPYGGGYDPNLTYGKPLSPSVEICYPRSTMADSKAPPSMDGFSKELVVAEKEEEKPKNEIEPIGDKGIEQAINGDHHDSRVEEEAEEEQGSFFNGFGNGRIEDYDCGYGYGYGYGHGYGYGYECDKQLETQTPSGYGSNAMDDICESLFGYWPCLSGKDDKFCNGGEGIGAEDMNLNHWNGTTTAADYLFGESSDPYSDRRVGVGLGNTYENPIFGYERHYQEPLLHMQIQYDENIDSWLQGFQKGKKYELWKNIL